MGFLLAKMRQFYTRFGGMSRWKKCLISVLLLYLVFDVRPLLLIPNLILCRKPCAKYTDGTRSMELWVFPRLCVAGDPIRVVIQSHGLPLGGAFARSYDRSGIFHEFQFSGTVNNYHPMETLYWTSCLGGGLGGDLHQEKKIWLGDYVHFSPIGRYRINLRYQDTTFRQDNPAKQIVYNLGTFSILYLPENPVSKFVKQIILTAGLVAPSDKVRTLAAKWLGYQETYISTYVLAKYPSIYEDWWTSTSGSHGKSLFESYRGTLRNYDLCSVGRILKRFDNERPSCTLGQYFHFHCYRLIFSADTPGTQVSPDLTEKKIARLIDCTYRDIDPASKAAFRKAAAYWREQATGEYWRSIIDKCDRQLAQATSETEITSIGRRKEWAAAQISDKKERDIELRLIDSTMARLQELDRDSTVVERTASH